MRGRGVDVSKTLFYAPTGVERRQGLQTFVYIPKKHSDKPAMVVELKYDKSAEGAITQMKEKKYVESLKEYHGNLLLVGINYDKENKKHTCVIEKWNALDMKIKIPS